METYHFVKLLIFLTGAVGLAGYIGLFAVFFRLWLTSYAEPIQWKRWYLSLILTSIAVPMILAFAAIKLPMIFGFRFHQDELGIIAGNAVFPLLSLPLMLFVLMVARLIWRYETNHKSFLGIPLPSDSSRLNAKQGLSQNEIQLGSCGCVLPLILFFVYGIILANLGYKFHDYNPNFDGPQPEWAVQNVNIIKSIGGICVLSIMAGATVFLMIAFPNLLGFKRAREPEPELPASKTPRFVEWIVVLAIIAGLVVLLLPAVKAAREGSRRAPIPLRPLAFAMHAYHQQYGSFPPAYTVDQDGKPLHSWRVLILPFCHKEKLYEKIRLDEPWDSEYNRQFHTATEDFFPYYGFELEEKRIRRRFDFGRYSDFSVIVGPTTVFPDAGCCKITDISNPDKTILLVERTNPICWMDPANELTQDEFNRETRRGNTWAISCSEYAKPEMLNKNLSPDRHP